MKQIAKEGITWEKDPDWGYDVPVDVPGLDLAKYDAAAATTRPRNTASSSRSCARERRGLARAVPGARSGDPRAIEG